jgi:hypothetical protein
LARLLGDDDVTIVASGAVTITGAGTLTKKSILYGSKNNGWITHV